MRWTSTSLEDHRPKAVTVVELGQIEPGFGLIEREAAASGIRHVEVVKVEPGETAKARFAFVPVEIHGVVNAPTTSFRAPS